MALIVEYSIFDDPAVDRVMFIIDTILLGIYTIEMLFRLVAVGFYWAGERSYLKNNWNKVDSIILAFSYVTICGCCMIWRPCVGCNGVLPSQSEKELHPWAW